MLCVVSVALMFADHTNRFFHRAREKATVVTLPAVYAVDLPVRAVESVVSNVRTRASLQKENTKLKAQNALLQSQIQKMITLETDNKALLALLQSSIQAGGNKVLEAYVIAVSEAPFQHELVVNKGQGDGVFEGQPVLDEDGVLGQVVAVDPLVSRVMLITDGQSAVPVQDQRSQDRAIAIGQPETGLLSLQDVPQTADFKEGDILLTSALGGHYPYGYPVAKIVSVEQDPNERFSQIIAKPLAHLNRSRLVLLVWPNNRALKQAAQAVLNPKPKESADAKKA